MRGTCASGGTCPFTRPLVLPQCTASRVPVLLLSVVAKDSWDRVVPCGYASLPLPLFPGTHSMDVPTWRPEGSVRTTSVVWCAAVL